jgi:hypothetical protein
MFTETAFSLSLYAYIEKQQDINAIKRQNIPQAIDFFQA